MEELIAKISSYNIFNNLVPGAVFSILNTVTGLYTVEFKSIVIELCAYYFVGMVVSRLGSLVLEPLLKYVGFLKFAKYDAFIEASRIDSKIDALSESNNLYRTVASALLCFIFLYLSESLVKHLGINVTIYRMSIILIVFIIFVMSYRKQTDYIRRRVEVILRFK